MNLNNVNTILKGGRGSGDWGHVGRAGKRGGSGGGGGKGKPRKGRRSREALDEEIAERSKPKNVGSTFSGGRITNNVKDLEKTDPNFKSLMEHMEKFPSWETQADPGVVNKIVKATGVDADTVEKYMLAWNGGDSADKYAMASAVREELGLELGPYEKKLDEERRKGAVKEGLMDPSLINDYKKIARASYEETQKQFEDMGITEVVAYRGMKVDVSKMNVGDALEWRGDSVDSWSISPDTAESFAGLFSGMVMKTSIPVERILSMTSSGAGTSSERELVIIGNNTKDDVVVSNIQSRQRK